MKVTEGNRPLPFFCNGSGFFWIAPRPGSLQSDVISPVLRLLRMVSQEYHFGGVLNLNVISGLALRVMAVRDLGSAR
jgi:hypothetical protein